MSSYCGIFLSYVLGLSSEGSEMEALVQEEEDCKRKASDLIEQVEIIRMYTVCTLYASPSSLIG